MYSPPQYMRIGPKTARIFLRYWRRDIIQTGPLHRALKVLFNAGMRGRDLDLTYDIAGPVHVEPAVARYGPS